MLVANSFDLWQKDALFPAAEEVQRSADIMVSAYRRWLSGRRGGLMTQHLDELGKELKMALSTAKWQLEEFERAACVSFRSCGDDTSMRRHGQFVSAIEHQISNVETALKETHDAEGKEPFHWVNLNREECDDLALFISGNSQRADECSVFNRKNECDDDVKTEIGSHSQILNQGNSIEEDVVRNEDANSFIKQEEGQIMDTWYGIRCQINRNSSSGRTWSLLDRSALEIVVDRDDDSPDNTIIEATPKDKGLKPFFWKSRGEEGCGGKGALSLGPLKMISWMNQRLRGHRFQRQQLSPALPMNSIRFVLALMLTIFFVGYVLKLNELHKPNIR